MLIRDVPKVTDFWDIPSLPKAYKVCFRQCGTDVCIFTKAVIKCKRFGIY